MSDREADKSKRPPECQKDVFTPSEPGSHRGQWGGCPHVHETSSNSDMEGETYDCAVCGLHYRLYYEDMQ